MNSAARYKATLWYIYNFNAVGS